MLCALFSAGVLAVILLLCCSQIVFRWQDFLEIIAWQTSMIVKVSIAPTGYASMA